MFRHFWAFQPGSLSVFVHPCPHGLRAHLLPAVPVAGKEQQRAGCQRLIRMKLSQVPVQHPLSLEFQQRPNIMSKSKANGVSVPSYGGDGYEILSQKRNAERLVGQAFPVRI